VTALDARILERKLEFMRRALLEMERLIQEGEAAYLASGVSQAVMERQIERLVEAAVAAAVCAPSVRHRYRLQVRQRRAVDVVFHRRGRRVPLHRPLVAPAHVRHRSRHERGIRPFVCPGVHPRHGEADEEGRRLVVLWAMRWRLRRRPRTATAWARSRRIGLRR
jgi:hypothetical protein